MLTDRPRAMDPGIRRGDAPLGPHSPFFPFPRVLLPPLQLLTSHFSLPTSNFSLQGLPTPAATFGPSAASAHHCTGSARWRGQTSFRVAPS